MFQDAEAYKIVGNGCSNYKVYNSLLMWITTKGVSSNPAHGQLYSIQHYVIQFVSDLRQVGGFLWVLRLPPPIKLSATI